MAIDLDFPSTDKLKLLELRTFKYLFKYLIDCKLIQEEAGFSVLKREANTYYSAFVVKKKRNHAQLDFQSYFDLSFNRKNWRFHLGSIIKNDYSQLTYYLAICELDVGNNKCSVRRKFHFDYDNGSEPSRQRHPIYHVQYAGKKPSGMGNHGELYEKILHSSLSEPRFSYTPMSMALLLNAIFNEFRTDITYKILEDRKWRDLIKSHEDALLKPYFRNCCQFLNSVHSSEKLLTTDYVYGD